MQQSRLAVETGESGEKTGEREGDAAVDRGDGDTSVTQRGQRLISDAQKELFSNNLKTARRVAGKPRVRAEGLRTLRSHTR